MTFGIIGFTEIKRKDKKQKYLFSDKRSFPAPNPYEKYCKL